MAFTGYRRFALGMMAALVTATSATPSYAISDRTDAFTDHGTTNEIVLGYVTYDRAFDLAPLALFDEQPAAITKRGYQTYKPLAVKQPLFGAAVRPTSKAGWGSGRLRKLAG